MNRKFILISLGIHSLWCLGIYVLSNVQNESPHVIQIGIEMNISTANSHVEQKPQLKKAKRLNPWKDNDNLAISDQVETQEDNSSEPIDQRDEVASGREQSLISQYASSVAKLVDEKKFYPLQAKRMKQEGEVFLRITINQAGKILTLEIEKASPYDVLNAASLECVKKISSFPPIPSELGVNKLTFSIPLEYKIL